MVRTRSATYTQAQTVRRGIEDHHSGALRCGNRSLLTRAGARSFAPCRPQGVLVASVDDLRYSLVDLERHSLFGFVLLSNEPNPLWFHLSSLR